MTSGRLPESKTLKVPRKSSIKTGLNGVQNFTKKSNRLSNKAQEHHKKDEFPTERSATLEFHQRGTGQAFISSGKIKLQLFPINKGTRIGLEKDGHNPYLELILNAQKKISSILKHLEKKWGSSIIAIGEPVLFPYDIMENLTNCRRWTSNDNDITAAEVHAAVGSPAIFRLRYGWFSIHEARSVCLPSTPIPLDATAQFGGAQGRYNTNIVTSYDEREKTEGRNNENTTFDMVDVTNVVVAKNKDDLSVKLLENEPRTSSGMTHSPVLWDDNLTNISIGALLSEASLQGKFSNSEAKSHGGNAGMQPSQIISDSLDAFIAAQKGHPQGSGQSSVVFRTSILDAEETCHAFPLQTFSSVGKDLQTLGGKAQSGACVQNDSSNLSKLPKADEVNDQAATRQDSTSRAGTELLLSSRIYDDERSLGLTGINWNDSLGPFDLGMPAKKFIGEDSFSIGGFVR